MPPKPKPATAPAETVQSVAEQLNVSEAAATKSGTAGSTGRAAIVTKLWTLILQSNAKQQEDLLKQCPPSRLLSFIEAAPSDPTTAYAAAGCLAALSRHNRWMDELTATAAVTNRVVCGCVLLLVGPHDRSRLPALQVMTALAACPMQVPRLSPALSPLLSLLSAAGGPGWAGGRLLAAAAATVLAALLAPSECEAAEQQQARRCLCLSSGAVVSLLVLLCGSSGGSSSSVLLPAAACLRYLALAPGAAEVMAGDPPVAAQLLQLLLPRPSSPPAVSAYISGILWELAASSAAAEQLVAAGAIPALLQLVQHTAAAVLGSNGSTRKKGKKKQQKGGKTVAAAAGGSDATKGKGGKGVGRKDGKAAAGAGGAGSSGSSGGSNGEGVSPPSFVVLQDPQAAAEVALCNATGTLHHLTFLDGAKAELGASHHLALLVTLCNNTQGQTYDNLVGVLWNVGLLDVNQPLLAAAGAPAHLVRPIPDRWVTTLSRSASAAAAAAAVGPKADGHTVGGAAAAAAVRRSAGDACLRQTTLRFV